MYKNLRIKIVVSSLTILALILTTFVPSISALSVNLSNNKSVETDDLNIESNTVSANFRWTPEYPDPGENVVFLSSSFSDEGAVYNTWIFHDGTTQYGSVATYTYEKAGRYKVILVAREIGPNIPKRSSTRTKYVDIGASPFPIFKLSPDNPSPGETVVFDASKSHDVNGKIVYYNWSLYNVENPANITYLGSDIITSYTFNQQGIYNISLFVEDNDGNNNTNVMTIPVSIIKLSNITSNYGKIKFTISNHGDIDAENLRWDIDIKRDAALSEYPIIYNKNDTINSLNISSSENVSINDFRKMLCKVKITVTARADNAIQVSRSSYALVLGNNIYLTEKDFCPPRTVIFITTLITMGIIYTIRHNDARITLRLF